MSSIPGEGTVPWSSKDLKTTAIQGNDELMILDSQATTKDKENKRILISDLPAGSGEINNGVNLGSGVIVFKDKSGVNLQFKTLNTQANLIDIAANGDGNTIDFTIGSNVARRDQSNDYGTNDQFFGFDSLTIRNPNVGNVYVFEAPVIASDRRLLLPLMSAVGNQDTLVVEAFAQTLTNKTLSTATNIFQGLTLGSTPADNKVVGASSDLTNGSDIALLSGTNTFANFLEAPGIEFNNAVPASVGAIRASHIDKFAWRNLANSADLFLEVAFQTPNEFLKFDGRFVAATLTQGTTGQVLTSNGLGALPTFTDGGSSVFPVSDAVFEIENDADNTKKIKFDLTDVGTSQTRIINMKNNNISLIDTSDGFIRNSNVGADAQILWNKMEDLPSAEILVGNGIAEATPVAMSGDATITSAGVVTVSSAFAKKTDNLSVFASTTSAQLAGVISDETGTASLVFSNAPTLVAPNLGTPTLLIGTNVTGISLSTAVIGILGVTNGGTGVTTSTGTGDNVLHDSPVLTTPNLGTPSVLNLSNATNLSLTSGVIGTLPVANGGTGVTTSTGTGSVVLSISPTLATPNLGTPSALNATNVTDLPLSTGVTGILPVANGGTGAITFTLGGVLIGNVTGAVTSTDAGNVGEVLASNGVGVAPTFKAPDAAILPVPDNVNLIKGSADATKLLRIDVSDNTTNVLGLLKTNFTVDSTLFFPNTISDTLVGKATTDTFTNKSYDANGTGNILTNVDIEDLTDRTPGQMISWDNTSTPVPVLAGTAGQVLVSNGAATPSFQTVFTALSTVFVKCNLSITSPATIVATVANAGIPITFNGGWSISEATNFELKIPNSEGVNEGVVFYDLVPNIQVLINYSVSIANLTNTEGTFVEVVNGGFLVPGSRVNSRNDKNSNFTNLSGSVIITLNSNDEISLQVGAEVISGGNDTFEIGAAQFTIIELS